MSEMCHKGGRRLLSTYVRACGGGQERRERVGLIAVIVSAITLILPDIYYEVRI